jgi:multiple sugar transport system substrate-binding protein
MKKLLSWIAFFSLCAVVIIAGCSGSAQDAGNKAVTSKNEPVTLKFTYWGSPIEKQAVEATVKKFQQKYDWITVDAQQIPADYPTKITAMVAGNEAPDVGYLSPNQAFPWSEEGKIANVRDFMKDDPDLTLDKFIPSTLFNWAPDKTFGWTIQTFGLFYNADLFKEAGAELPPTKAEEAWTWDKFVETARKLTIDRQGKNALDPGFNPKQIKQYGVQFGTDVNSWYSMVQSNGGEYITTDGKFGLTDPKASDAVQKMADLINVYHVAPSPVDAKSIPAPAVALQSKQLAMTITGQYILLDLANAGLNFGVGVLPKLQKSTTLITGSPTVIFNSTKHPKEAWLFLKSVRNPDLNVELFEKGLWMPYTKDWYTDPQLIAKWAEGNKAHPNGYKDAIMKQAMANGIPGPANYVKNFAKIDAIVNPALDKVWMGERKAADALKEIEPKVIPEIKGRYDAK